MRLGAGANVDALANDIAAYDLAKVVKVTNSKIAEYTPDGYSDALEKVVHQLDPQLVVMPHTYLVRDFAPKVAARFKKSLISDCIRTRRRQISTQHFRQLLC